MDGDPHAVLEGMIIASYAHRRPRGLHLRARRVPAGREAPAHGHRRPPESAACWATTCSAAAGTSRLKIKEGAGAFVCGEETALIASIEGRRGMPRKRPPFPAVSGLWGKPTNINNVETYANVPWIVAHGAAAYAAYGTEGCRGTKAFSLAGKIVNGGLAEVPMGSTLRQVIFDVGGGIKDGREFKAVQLGGPSGGCVPASLLDTPIDYESLAATGAIMGSGRHGGGRRRRPAWSTWRATSCSSRRTRAAASACPAASAPSACWRSWTASPQGEGADGDIETPREAGRAPSSAPASAVWARRRPTRCSPPSVLPRRVRGAHRAAALPGARLHRAHRLLIDAEACTGCMLCAKKCPVDAITGAKKRPTPSTRACASPATSAAPACKFDAVKVVSGPDEIAAAVAAQVHV